MPTLPGSYFYFRLASRLAAGLCAAIIATAATADDRDLLRTTSSDPYVFILFDVSGSMNWSPRCTQTQLDNGICEFLCPTGDCLPRRSADDPASKFRQAKEAIYEVLGDVENVHFGFASYNQDSLRVRYKHWLYRATSNGPELRNSSGTVVGRFPQIDHEVTFGETWGCDSGGGDNNIGCYSDNGNQADLDDSWEVERVLRYPKLDENGTTATTLYVRTGGTTYRITWDDVSGQRPWQTTSPYSVNVTAARCTNSSCSNVSGSSTNTVAMTHTLIGQFLSWDNGAGRTNPTAGWWPQSYSSDSQVTNTCAGWDSNTDSSSDDYSGYNLRWTTGTDPRGSLLRTGDIVPLDWNADNRQLILDRLIPDGVNATQASYFGNTKNSDGVYQLLDGSRRPLLANGSTPIGASMRDFRGWYAGCETGNCTSSQVGWSDLAAAQDPSWACRRKYLLIVTDGDETCGGDPCTAATDLKNRDDVLTYVVAYGVEGTTGNQLDCIAENGGTDEPIYPQNKQELVDALTSIFGEIAEETRAFASSAVPSVQADASDRIYRSRFIPLNGESVWPGSVDAFLKPLPLTSDGQPDTADDCAVGDQTSECHLWEAGEELYALAPTEDEVAAGTLRLGEGANERRVFHMKKPSATAVPASLRLFEPPAGAVNACAGYPLITGCSDWWDLYEGFGLQANGTTQARATSIIGKTLVRKTGVIDLVGGGSDEVDYVLGDLFHSDPVFVERPLNFELFARNLFDDGEACDEGNPGYRCFARKHQYRRKLLLIGANDGQLHAFDAGQWNNSEEFFTNGTGKELFSIIPRAAMPMVRDQATGNDQVYSMDGSARVEDVFIDPQHNGTPTPADREWRTVFVTGMREGGSKFPSQTYSDRFEHVPGVRQPSSYLAVDITQPDRLGGSEGTIPDDQLVPTCLDEDHTAVSGCGPLPYPAVLWEFFDRSPSTGIAFDEDSNSIADLADTWSRPILGRIRVVVSGNEESREVAVFGGGMDTPYRDGRGGRWIYMVDIETGRAIYKRPVTGSVPANIAVQDRDSDAYLDTIYFGTTAGTMYKVDISEPQPFTNVNARDLNGVTTSVPRITAAEWTPFPIFQTGPTGNPGAIFVEPTVFYIATQGIYALGFGTGDRENLWRETEIDGRFYLIYDPGFSRQDFLDGDLPVTEADLSLKDLGSGSVAPDSVTLSRGWYFSLEEEERVITTAEGAAGLLLFSSFQPQTEILVGNDEGDICARTGVSRIFVVNLISGNGLLPGGDRWVETAGAVTPPTMSTAGTINRVDPEDPPEDEDLTPEQTEIIAQLKALAPRGTQYGEFYQSLPISTTNNVQILEVLIPIAVYQSGWKDF